LRRALWRRHFQYAPFLGVLVACRMRLIRMRFSAGGLVCLVRGTVASREEDQRECDN